MSLLKKRSSLQFRIFTATLIPLLCIFVVIILLANEFIRDTAEQSARETARDYTCQLSSRISMQMALMVDALDGTRKSLGAIPPSPRGEDVAENILLSLLGSVPGVYNVWFVFEPDFFLPGEHFVRSYTRTEEGIRELDDITQSMLDDPTQSPWYAIPLRSRKDYYKMFSSFDYGQGALQVAEFSFPIYRNDEIVGCVGLDIRYEHLLEFMNELHLLGASPPSLLLSEKRDVLFATTQAAGYTATDILLNPYALAETLHSGQVSSYYSSGGEKEKSFICLSKVKVAQSSDAIILYVEIPHRMLAAQYSPLIRLLGLIMAVSFLLFAASTFLTTRNIIRPLALLKKNANYLAAGKIDPDLLEDLPESSANSELHSLHAALKSVLRQLSQMHELKVQVLAAKFEQEKLKNAAKAKSQFFASISHEIRTPMNAITGLTELLLRDNGLSAIQRRYVLDIKLSSNALLTIINDILDSAKMDLGKLKLVPEHYCLNTMLSNLCSVGGMMARHKGLEFSAELADDLPECLYGDGVRLRQILINVLNNAVKYTQAGYVHFSAFNEGRSLRFEISDTGIGIKNDVLPFIFDPYTQADENNSVRIEGTGLGLNITRHLLDLMHGDIRVSSEYGKGSTFTIHIPFTPGDASLLSERCTVVAPGTWDAKALLVDDNKLNLVVSDRLLSLHGLSCDTALSGQEAVELAANNRYDIIFMDHIMPGMDGIETARAIREQGGHNAEIPIIALTANAVSGAKEMLLEMGMSDFLSKPIETHMLLEILHTWLPQKRQPPH